MNNYTDIEFIIQQTYYWAKRLKIKNLNVDATTKMWGTAKAWEYNTKGNPEIQYNPRYIIGLSKAQRLHIMFHEIGHLKGDNFSKFYPKYYGKIITEYIAESRAWKWMKKYFPEYYEINKKTAKEDLYWLLTFDKKYSYYFIAYSQIPENAKYI